MAAPACRGHRARQWVVTGLDDGMAVGWPWPQAELLLENNNSSRRTHVRLLPSGRRVPRLHGQLLVQIDADECGKSQPKASCFGTPRDGSHTLHGSYTHREGWNVRGSREPGSNRRRRFPGACGGEGRKKGGWLVGPRLLVGWAAWQLSPK